MTSSAADELSEALTRLQGERETILGEIATIERDLGERHESLSDVNEKIEALARRHSPCLRPDLVRDLERPAPPEDEDELAEASAGRRHRQRRTSQNLPRQTAVLGILAGAQPRPCTTRRSRRSRARRRAAFLPNLSHLKYRDLVETTDPGHVPAGSRARARGRAGGQRGAARRGDGDRRRPAVGHSRGGLRDGRATTVRRIRALPAEPAGERHGRSLGERPPDPRPDEGAAGAGS